MTGQMSPLEYRSVRSYLALRQSTLASKLYCSERTIRRMERGESLPLPLIQAQLIRIAGRSKDAARRRLLIVPGTEVRIYRLNLHSYYRHAGPHPARIVGWRHMTWSERGRALRWRRYYQRVRAEADAGRAVILWRNQ